ncbi:Ankyrin repeat-containing domain protein [Russula decolorans]
MSSLIPHPDVSLSQFQDLFDAALWEYNQKTGKDIMTDPLTARLLYCGSSDAVLGILQEQAHAFNQYRNGDWKVQLMRRLKPTVDILFGLSTGGVFGEGIGLRLPPSKAIFAGVGLLLAAATGVRTSYDALLELFECFEHYLGRLKVLTEFPSAVREILVKIMVELLEVLALATQQIKQGRFKKFARKLLGENDIEAVLQRLDRLTMEESRMTATQTMEVVYGLFNNMKVVMNDGKASIDHIREALVTMQKISDDLNKMKRNKLRRKIQKWLSPPDPSLNHNTACEAHHNGTAAWFLEGATYNEWKATGSLLWTHGNPGSGKSILCSSIINDIESTHAAGLASIAYYYFDFKDTGKQDRRGLLSSLLTQLCMRSHPGHDILSNLYEAYDDGLRQPSEVDLIQCLKKVLALPGHGKVYMIVDALDESPNKPGIPSPREKVLQFFKELVNLRHPDIRVCVTSRPEVDIRTVLEPLASHSVSLHDQAGQRSDIVNYVKSVLDSDANLRKWRRKDRQLVINTLSQKAIGMFRWVVCQLDTLRRCFPASIRRALNELPRTLDETYERILLGIDEEKQEYAIRLFRCLAFSRRPLRVKELAEVIAVEFDAGRIPRLNVNLRPGDADKAVLSACSTLVEIIKPDGNTLYNSADRVVQFSHYSVKEFLTSERLAKSMRRDLSHYHISPEPAHTVLAQNCISTLLQLDNDIEGIHRGFPLAEYASRNWFHHAQCHGVASRIQKGMERLFDPDRRHFSIWTSMQDMDGTLSWERSTRTKASPLYYAALCGIGSLVEHLVVTRRQDPNQSRGSQGTPLHVAVVSGHTSIARLLLEHAADANARDMNNVTPLHEAIERGNLDIAQLLINHGADVNAFVYRSDYQLRMAVSRSEGLGHAHKDMVPSASADENARGKSKSTPLHSAAKRGNLKTAQLLIGHGADVNILDDQRDSPLHKALQYQKFGVVELLVKGGADVNVRNIHHSSPLYEAVEIGSLDAVRSLLSHGAIVNTLGRKGDSPLHKAGQLQKLDIVELLLERGADVNIRNMYSSTPLHEAVHGGNLNIMRLLIDHGADVNSSDYQGDSPLRKALRSQKPDVVELLLKGGANVNSRNIYNSTLLHEAVESGNINIVQLLLGHGADVNALDSFGDSSLHKAFRSQNTDFEEFFVNSATNTNTSRNRYSMPLHHTSQQGIYAMAQLLLGHGANVNARGRGHKTPLHLSSLGGSLDVSRLLIERGADVDAQDDKCQTPFSMALALGHRKLARFLSNSRVPEQDS